MNFIHLLIFTCSIIPNLKRISQSCRRAFFVGPLRSIATECPSTAPRMHSRTPLLVSAPESICQVERNIGSLKRPRINNKATIIWIYPPTQDAIMANGRFPEMSDPKNVMIILVNLRFLHYKITKSFVADLAVKSLRQTLSLSSF